MIIGWRVNGTSIGQLKDPNVIPRTIRDESDQLVDILTILALPQYNNTEVQCVAIVLVPNITRELTSVAILIIQEGKFSKQTIMNNYCAPVLITTGFNDSTVTAFEGSDGRMLCICIILVHSLLISVDDAIEFKLYCRLC